MKFNNLENKLIGPEIFHLDKEKTITTIGSPIIYQQQQKVLSWILTTNIFNYFK